MLIDHSYRVELRWTGNRGSGTSDYRAYGRDNVASVEGKPELLLSADRPFRGDPDRWNPEELLVAALSECHLLSYLHVAAAAGVVVVEYSDVATGTMVQTPDGGGHITEVTLHPTVRITDAAQTDLARSLHAEANGKCFIAASVNFPVHHAPTITT